MRRILPLVCLVSFLLVSSVSGQLHWVPTNGPGLDVPTILEVNTNGDILAGRGRVLFRSIDAGVSWQRFPIPKSLGSVQGITTLPSAKIVLRMDGSVLVRTDADGSGAQILPFRIGTAIFADRAGVLFSVQNSSNILRSTNAGNSWDTVLGPQSESLAGFTADQLHYYVTTNSGIYTSTDKGASWKRCLNGLITANYYFILAGHAGHVWATCYDGSSSFLYFSTDYGLHWTRPCGADIHFAILANTNNEILFSNNQYFHDSSSTAFNLPGSLGHFELDSSGRWIAPTSYGTNLHYAATGKPSSWNGLSVPMSSLPTLFRANDRIFVGSGTSQYVQDSVGKWIPSQWKTASFLGVDRFDHSLLGTTSGSDLLRSTDSGAAWKNILGALPNGTVRVAVTAPARIYAATKGVFYSDDTGKTWSETNDNAIVGAVGSLCADSSGTLYACTATNLFKTTDGGNQWQQVTMPPKMNPGRIIANKSGTIAIYCSPNALVRSRNQGVTWELTVMPDQSAITDFLLSDSNDVYASSSTGVYYWPRASKGMYNLSDGLDSLGVNALARDAAGAIYASTTGAGVYKSVGVPLQLGVRTAITQPLIPAFPNPASERITIALPSAGVWSVTARDPLGRSISLHSVVSGESVQCDVDNLSPGAYELTLHSEKSTFYSRLVIVR